jgi:HAD superfamily hydrolase (TIGR01662 family)
VTRLTFLGLLGATIERGDDHREVFRLLRPGLDLRAAAAEREAAGEIVHVIVDDLYPDALPCLRSLASSGYRLGVVGNQPEQTEELLRSLDVGLELIASSATLGVPKPEPAFFEAIVERLGLDPAAIAYVGDRVDNDIAPAAAIGMRTILVRRGPWAWIQSGRADPPMADAVIEDLRGLPAVLAALTGG